MLKNNLTNDENDDVGDGFLNYLQLSYETQTELKKIVLFYYEH